MENEEQSGMQQTEPSQPSAPQPQEQQVKVFSLDDSQPATTSQPATLQPQEQAPVSEPTPVQPQEAQQSDKVLEPQAPPESEAHPEPPQPAPASEPASVEAVASQSVEAPLQKAHSGSMKWIVAGVVVLMLAGTAIGLYSSGVFNPPPQNPEQLKGAAEQPSNLETPAVTPTQEQTRAESQQTSQITDLSNITQITLNACPTGQVMDPISSRCACDINNNYFDLNLPDAYTQPTAGIQPVQCTTCAQLSDQILTLGQSIDPADISKKTQLQAVAEQNNCSPCAVYDDRIAQAQQTKTWDQYFNLVVQKSEDKTCGRTLSTCDSLKWQLLFLNDLRDKAGKDPGTTPDMLQTLKDKQASLEEDLGNNTACYNVENLCMDLKTIYGDNTVAILSQPGQVSTAPLLGTSSTSTAQASQQHTQASTQEQLALSSTQEASTQPDLSSITLDQLFTRDFYMLHCPVDGLSQQSTPTQETHPKVKVHASGTPQETISIAPAPQPPSSDSSKPPPNAPQDQFSPQPQPAAPTDTSSPQDPVIPSQPSSTTPTSSTTSTSNTSTSAPPPSEIVPSAPSNQTAPQSSSNQSSTPPPPESLTP